MDSVNSMLYLLAFHFPKSEDTLVRENNFPKPVAFAHLCESFMPTHPLDISPNFPLNVSSRLESMTFGSIFPALTQQRDAPYRAVLTKNAVYTVSGTISFVFPLR
jgi:hypothetical protein